MFFMNRFNAAAPKASRTIAKATSPRRRRTPISLETLEVRDLKSGISMSFGAISIQGTGSGNSAHVSRVGDNVRVQLNNQVVEYTASEVYAVTYTGGSGGSDTFVNDTNLYSQMYGFGGNNQFTGGSSFNTVYMYGNFNNYSDLGGASYVFSYDGPQSTIALDGNNYVFAYSTANFYFV